jgi:hypothetical protein
VVTLDSLGGAVQQRGRLSKNYKSFSQPQRLHPQRVSEPTTCICKLQIDIDGPTVALNLGAIRHYALRANLAHQP